MRLAREYFKQCSKKISGEWCWRRRCGGGGGGDGGGDYPVAPSGPVTVGNVTVYTTADGTQLVMPNVPTEMPAIVAAAAPAVVAASAAAAHPCSHISKSVW